MEHLVYDTFYDLVVRMAAMPHGGLLAISQNLNTTDGKFQIPLTYRDLLARKIRDCDAVMGSLGCRQFMTEARDNEQNYELEMDEECSKNSRDSLERTIESIAQLTAVDNALLLGPNLDVLCAGFKIQRETKRNEQALIVIEAGSLNGNLVCPFPLVRHGSKHQAAAAFAYDNAGGLAFLASEDGAVRCLHRQQGSEHVILWDLLIDD